MSFEIGKETPIWFVRILILIFILVIVAGIVMSYVNRTIDTREIEARMLMNRLLVSKTCFNDDRYSNTIALSRFNEENLKKCLDFGTASKYGVELRLKDFDGSELKVITSDKDQTNLKYFCSKKSVYYCYSRQDYVLINDNGMKKGILESIMVIK